MKNLKKTLALVAALALSATALYGCGDKTESSSKAPATTTTAADDSKDETTAADDSKESSAADVAEDTGDQLTILCWNTDDSQPMVDLFCQETGTDASKINIKSFGVQGGQAAEQYTAYLSDASNDADIMFLEADWALQFINDDEQTVPLSDIGLSEGDFKDLYPYVLEIGKSTTTGDLKGVSWQSAAGGYCYREDLAEKYLSVKSPEEMQAKVADWDKFKATAKELSDATSGKTALSATLGGVWQVYSGSRDTAWVKDDTLVVDDYCKNYAEFAKELWTNGYVTQVAQWADEWKPLGQTDDVMGFFVSTWGFGDTILTAAAGGEGGATYGKWKCVVGPEEFYWGGTWLAPTKRCDNPNLAAKFIKFFTTDADTAEKYALSKGEYMSNQKVMEKIISDKSYKGAGVLGGQNQFEVLNEVAQGIDMTGKITPYDARIKTEFSNAVQDYAKGDYATVDDALEAFKDAVASKITDITVE
ncbi:MAG: ABC transporter substrate-binding protein [Oscillospiraceae bacterium]|nr:ABC transporter substrate-binding protein [Oscillospiraceae bacterium]